MCVTNKSIVLNLDMLNVNMLNVFMLKVIMLKSIMLNLAMLNVDMLNAIMLNAIMLNVIMLNVIMLNVVALYSLSSAVFHANHNKVFKKSSSSLCISDLMNRKRPAAQNKTSFLLKSFYNCIKIIYKQMNIKS
jgi:hypothetical protein